MPDAFQAYLVEKDPQGQVTSRVVSRSMDELPPGEVTVRVRWSSVNYKDALAATGHPGVARTFPHVPGIDAAGEVIASAAAEFPIGTPVIATGHELGVERWGGWAELVRVPAAWLVRLPDRLSPEEAMLLGTAGFTAAQCVIALQHAGLEPGRGPIVVTGATGGVGSISVAILAKLGYEVVAISGKSEKKPWLQSLGAASVIDRDDFKQAVSRPLLKAQWKGGIDTVGGEVLSTLIKSIDHRGCVAACGVVGGADLSLTVYPFILRGVTLAGIDSAWCPDLLRREIWQKLATEWKPDSLAELRSETTLEGLPKIVESILAGQHVGRTIVRM